MIFKAISIIRILYMIAWQYDIILTSNGFMIINHSHRRMNDLDSFLIKNNAQPTPRRSTSHRALFPAQGNSQQPLINKENTYSNNVSPGRASRKPMISPRKSQRSLITQANAQRHSQHIQQWRPQINESALSSVGASVCGNHENKSAEFQIVIDDEVMFYCEKCAAKLASQGFPVKKIMERSESKSLKDNNKNMANLQQFAGNPFYEELISILKSIAQAQESKQHNLDRFQSVSQHFNGEIDKIVNMHEKFHEIIELSKEHQLSLLTAQQQKYAQICAIQKDHLQEESSEINTMKEDIEINMQTIVIEVQNNEDSFRECVQTYKSKVEVFKHKLEEQIEMLSGIKQISHEEQQEKVGAFNSFVYGLWEEKKKTRPSSNIQLKPLNKTPATNKEQQNNDSYEVSKGPFRNLFESECEQSLQSQPQAQYVQRGPYQRRN